MIELCHHDGENYATPVIGSVGKDIPTSGDVHLYSDPQTVNSDHPILYADCEGLEGGGREPLGAWRITKDKGSARRWIGSFTSQRDITWANTSDKQSREYAVTHLYPRLLYTFSDIIVFVLKNPRYIQVTFLRVRNLIFTDLPYLQLKSLKAFSKNYLNGLRLRSRNPQINPCFHTQLSFSTLQKMT